MSVKYVLSISKLTFDAGGFIIQQQDHITILGFVIQNNLNQDKQVNETLKSCYFKLHCLNQITKYLNFKNRLQLANSIIIGKLLYGFSQT